MHCGSDNAGFHFRTRFGLPMRMVPHADLPIFLHEIVRRRRKRRGRSAPPRTHTHVLWLAYELITLLWGAWGYL